MKIFTTQERTVVITCIPIYVGHGGESSEGAL